MSITEWWKRLWCKHSWFWKRNIYGDEIIAAGWNRSWWECAKCGKQQLLKPLGGKS